MTEFRVWLLHLTAPTLGLSFEPRQRQSFLEPSSLSSCQRKLLERSATVRAARPREKERGGLREVSGVLACPRCLPGLGTSGPLRVRLIGLCTWRSISFNPLLPKILSNESVHRRTAAIHFPDFSSYGAPVPDEPRNSFRPSGNVTSRPFALFEPSLDT